MKSKIDASAVILALAAINGATMAEAMPGDAKAGDVNGDNQGNVWHVIKPGRAAQSAPAGSTTMGYSY
jgi:hypothetical protein